MVSPLSVVRRFTSVSSGGNIAETSSSRPAFGRSLIAAGSVVSSAAFGDWSVLPSLVGVSASILFSGLGLSSIMSARFPYPAVRPGDSPFAQPQSGSPAGLIQAVSFLAILLLSLPALYAAFRGLTDGGAWPLYSLAAGLAIGLLVLLGGVAWGGWIFERRGSHILALAMRN